MFENPRKDYTQELFDKFLKYQIITPDGFHGKGVIVLTSDYKIYNKCLEVEKEKLIKSFKENGKDGTWKIEKLSRLPLSSDNLIANVKLSDWWNNALFCRQLSASDGWSGRDLGGATTIILSQDQNSLKDFIPVLVNEHIKEFGIELNPKYSIYHDFPVPPLTFELSHDNEKVELPYYGVYATRLSMKDCIQDLTGLFASTSSAEEQIEGNTKDSNITR